MSTSGSSGEPKIVAVPQRGVLRLVCGTDYVRITRSDVVAQASSLAFDASTFEIWGALLNGAELAVIDRSVLLDPARLSAAVARLGVTVLFVTTALFNQLVATAPEVLSRLRYVLFGGERVEPRAVREALTQRPSGLVHVYGPTESTTFATWYPIADVQPQATNVPIGRPIANTTAHVVDDQLRLVPAGALGELVIGGDGLARGYLHDPRATAAAFVPDPFSPVPGARMYRTGDLVRRGPDGQIEFAGRRDTQIKLHGFRIELGEIEAALGRHPAVRHAVATVEGERGSARLVAYAAASDRATAPTGEELRVLLATHLPRHAVPSTVHVVDELPLNANGKVDRPRLKAPPEPDRADFTAPRTGLERTIASIWQDVLRRPRVGVTENFFDIGGNSLLLVNLVNRLRRRLDLDVDVIDLFSCPTVAALAARLSQAVGQPDDNASADAIRERGARRAAAVTRRKRNPK
jgi:acyl-coenzyme A synthetase/AMP-(fatty) acid ligase/aryl carrier-like protein